MSRVNSRWQVAGQGARGSCCNLAQGVPTLACLYRIILTDAERANLNSLIHSGTTPAYMITHARILLKADHGKAGPGWSDAVIVGVLDVNASIVLRIRRQFVPEGLPATLAGR